MIHKKRYSKNGLTNFTIIIFFLVLMLRTDSKTLEVMTIPLYSYVVNENSHRMELLNCVTSNFIPIYDYQYDYQTEFKEKVYKEDEQEITFSEEPIITKTLGAYKTFDTSKKSALQKANTVQGMNLTYHTKKELKYAERVTIPASGNLENNAFMNEMMLDEFMKRENEIHTFQTNRSPQQIIDFTTLNTPEDLLKTFYTVDKYAYIEPSLLNLSTLKNWDMTVKKEDIGPQILIYHTHSSEGYADTEAGDPNGGVLGAGEQLKSLLEEQYGYQVYHHTGVYDKVRDDAYQESLPALNKILEENPSIQVVIDLHRDSANPNRNMVMDIDGKKTARFMFFNGVSGNNKVGKISYLQNDNLAENLAFSFQMEIAAETYFPGITRRIYLKQYRYNMHLKGKTMLIELGDESNTEEEVNNACYIIAFLLNQVLNRQME